MNLEPTIDLNGAAFHGHWQLCQFLLSQGADPDFRLTPTGETALHATLCHPNRPVSTPIARLLLESGADPGVTTIPGHESGNFMRDVRTVGETPLHLAAAYGDEGVISLLLEFGADKSKRDNNGETPLSWASRHCRPGSILKLLEFGEYHIHDLHVQTLRSDHGFGWGGGMSVLRMGRPLK